MEKASFTRKYFEDIPGLDTPDGWQRFLDFVLHYADSFCLSFYTDCSPFRELSPEDLHASQWGFLSGSITDWEVTTQSPVTARAPMLLLYFRLDPVTTSFLRGRRTVLDFPAARLDRGFLCFDDLAFLKDGKIFFCSCTHEKYCAIAGDAARLYQDDPLRPIDGLDTEAGWQRFLDFALGHADSFSLSFRALPPTVARVEEFRNSQWGFLYPSARSQEITDRTALPLGGPVRLLYFHFTLAAVRFLRTLSHVYDLEDTEEMPSGPHWMADLAFYKAGHCFFASRTDTRTCGTDRAVLALLQDAEAATTSQKG